MFPEQLYLPTSYDYAVGIAPRRFTFRHAITGSASGVLGNAIPPVQANTVLRLLGFTVSFYGPVAGVEVIRALGVLHYTLPFSGWHELAQLDSNLAVLGNSQAINLKCDALLMPSEQIRAEGEKSGAIEVFSLIFTCWGFILPRANIQSG